LQLDGGAHGTELIAQVQRAGRLDAGQDSHGADGSKRTAKLNAQGAASGPLTGFPQH